MTQQNSTNHVRDIKDDISVLDRLHGSKHEMIDCHVHIVNFLQETPGLWRLIEYMDDSNIKKAVVFGLPVAKQWTETEREPPEYYLDDDSDAYYYSATDAIVATEYLKLDEKSQARLYPTICGFNPNDCHAIKHIERMYKMFPGVFCGIGETFFRHDDLTLLQQGEISRMNNKAVYPILEFCSTYQLPFLVHANVTTTWAHDYPKFLHELEEALRLFPKAPVVFCHCGISRRVYAPFYHQMIERLLAQYPALYVDFSWILFDEIICKWWIPSRQWIDLTERFSDRIFLGSDVIGNFYKLGVTNARFDPFLDALTPEARTNICINNAERLYGGRKGRVEKGERLHKPSF